MLWRAAFNLHEYGLYRVGLETVFGTCVLQQRTHINGCCDGDAGDDASRLRPTSITHSLLGLHSIVTQSTVVFTDSQFPDPASPASHARTSQWLSDQIALPPTKKYN